MIILQDTRETLPLDFTNVNSLLYKRYVDSTERVTLPFGDYGCKYNDGWVSNTFYERNHCPIFGAH